MKRLLTILLVAMLLLPCLVTGCNKNNNNTDTPTTEQTSQETTPEITTPEIIIPEESLYFSDSAFSKGSTDMGDLSCIMPVIHPYAGGGVGTGHGNDYYIKDAERACVKSAKWQLEMLTLLLENGAHRAKEITNNYTPQFKSKEEFLAFQDSISRSGNMIEYLEDGTARIKL